LVVLTLAGGGSVLCGFWMIVTGIKRNDEDGASAFRRMGLPYGLAMAFLLLGVAAVGCGALHQTWSDYSSKSRP
jgi:hypothetical protein